MQDDDHFFLVAGGHIFFQAMSAGVSLNLFTLLHREPGLDRATIAARIGIEEQPTRILLLALASCKMLRKSGDGYHNVASGERWLSRDSKPNLVAVIQWQHYINYKAMYHFDSALRRNRNVGLCEFPGEEPTLYQRLAHQPQLETIFQEAMQNLSDQANRELAELVDFAQFAHVVDVGGGNGSNIMALARRHPRLRRASIFDSPSVCEIARANIAESAMSDRCGATEGSCFADPLPEADCFLLCHFCTIWSVEENSVLLQKIFDGLPTGGALVIFNMMQDDDETGPMTAAIGSPYFLTLATGTGMLFTWAEYEGWMADAGFARTETHRLSFDHGVIIGWKG
ncbi:MAG: SAM-dependent methyltransferase [Rhodothermales bacterium]|jgi:SAM-dependent methyltransferase